MQRVRYSTKIICLTVNISENISKKFLNRKHIKLLLYPYLLCALIIRALNNFFN